MRKGIRILQETEGAGDIADREKTVIVNIRLFLPGGSDKSFSLRTQRMHSELPYSGRQQRLNKFGALQNCPRTVEPCLSAEGKPKSWAANTLRPQCFR
jgi:hypothetical protein